MSHQSETVAINDLTAGVMRLARSFMTRKPLALANERGGARSCLGFLTVMLFNIGFFKKCDLFR